MRRFLSIGTTFLLAMSITGCANKNNLASNTPNQTTAPSKISSPSDRTGATDRNSDVGKYNNGIYVGQGTVKTNGSGAAIVTIRNGAIDNIELLTIDSSGKVAQSDATINSTITEPNAINAPTPTPTTGSNTVPGTTMPAGTDTGLPNTVTSSENASNNNNKSNPSLASAKKDLINNVINSQTVDVNINADGNVKEVVDDWKVAIQNALNKAT